MIISGDTFNQTIKKKKKTMALHVYKCVKINSP